AKVQAYVAICDHQESVSLELRHSLEVAEHQTQAGIRRLFELAVHNELAAHIDFLPELEDLCAKFAPWGGHDALRRELADLATQRAFMRDDSIIRTGAEFERRLR